jgi:hypothetical protein
LAPVMNGIQFHNQCGSHQPGKSLHRVAKARCHGSSQ